jgi:2-keto-3-deoxy-L-fuconate dehydrogenase
MGSAVCELFAEEGAAVTADESDLTAASGRRFDTPRRPCRYSVVNLMERNRRHAVVDTRRCRWAAMFDAMSTHCTGWCGRCCRNHSSAGPAKSVMGAPTPCAARLSRGLQRGAGAQLAYVRNVGIETAGQGVNVNAIAQNWVSNPTSYSRRSSMWPISPNA